MKKILILAAAAAVLCSCANKNKYAVDGKVEGANSMVYLFDEKDNILDSAAAANGVFRFEGVAEKPQAAILRDARDDGATFGAMLILEPGTINVTDDALNSGKVAFAGLDVVSTEPIRADNPLLKAKNCIITPHMSWGSRGSRQRIMDCTVSNVQAFLNGAPENVVNR